MPRAKRYRYAGQLTPDGVAYRPLIDIEIAKGEHRRVVTALIDSGTDTLVIDASLATSLNINRDDCEKRVVEGINGKKEGFICDVSIKLLDFPQRITARALFVENTPFGVLLGQRDFFKNYRVLFELDKHEFSVTKAPTKKK